ncbi:hypothetical protein OV079_23105 [Nannocystis pusilla]|uniref:Uncharacterized protein n=1 Tax=Nannocystis pusilla TaxID=889268 RepID=A0A9X3EQR6_9BACT|nr:hypothetical protein [Nannocystis pusilla]MCY1008392.1 hypothetical protein [Nannocystis pusilla]
MVVPPVVGSPGVGSPVVGPGPSLVPPSLVPAVLDSPPDSLALALSPLLGPHAPVSASAPANIHKALLFMRAACTASA